MEHLTPTQIWTAVLAVASAIVLMANAAEKIAKTVVALKAPNKTQDERLDALEESQRRNDEYFRQDKQHLENLEKSTAVTQRALLALLGHGLHGNNVDQMQASESELQNHLINR